MCAREWQRLVRKDEIIVDVKAEACGNSGQMLFIFPLDSKLRYGKEKRCVGVKGE